MSKVLAGTAFVLLGGATATGGVLLLSKGYKSSDGVDNGKKPVEEQVNAELSETLSNFKTQDKDKEHGCVKTLFPGLKNVGTESDTTNVDKSFFDTNKKTEGCLVVNWDKNSTSGDDAKWHGTFRLLWAAKGSGSDGAQKGFMVFLAGKTPAEESKQEIQWEGGIYTLTASGENPTWTAKKRHETDTASPKVFKKENGDDVSKKFPHPGPALKGDNKSSDVPDFWKLMSGTGDLAKIAASTTSGTTKTSLKGYWKWSSEVPTDQSTNKKKLSEWTKDLDTWWKEIFNADDFKAKELGEAHQGLWTQSLWQ